ncbi:aspartate/glutamate racemase family protein [Candidatus Gottesmanbacteria bacterium]|nr:aspartate/glutamate racemase family protein [Candidatus Gottesmanbacteria bacterium]
MKNKQIIGVIGGMGPQASAEFYRILIDQAQHAYGAENNDEYPEIVLDSVPVPYFIGDTHKMEEAAQMLESRVRRLTEFSASTITMACNTACILVDRLQRQTIVPFISVVHEVVKEVSRNTQRVLLLASPTSLRLGVYQRLLARHNLPYILPREQDYQELEYIIRGVLAGENRGMLTKQLITLVNHYREKERVEGIILGCTELPLVFPKDYDIPVYNSLSILANSILKQYYNKEAICS